MYYLCKINLILSSPNKKNFKAKLGYTDSNIAEHITIFIHSPKLNNCDL